MGYHAYVNDHVLRIRPGGDAKIIKHFKNTPRMAHLLGAKFTSVVDLFEEQCFEEFQRDEDGNVTILHWSSKYRDEDEFWSTLAPFIERDSRYPDMDPYVEYIGEDDARWRLVFRNGEMQTEGAEIVWSYESETLKQRDSATVEPLVLEGRARQMLLDAIKRHVQHYIDLFGEEPEDESIQTLIRECRMTIKSIEDADKVALNLEVVR